jgi:hypothetical protein
MPYDAIPLALFVQAVGTKSSCIGISFVDSTTFDLCDSHRISATQSLCGDCTKWQMLHRMVYRFRLHLAINGRGEILNFA